MKPDFKKPIKRFKRFNSTPVQWKLHKLGESTEKITKGTTPLDKSWTGVVNYIKTENIDEQSGKLSRGAYTSLEEHEGYLKRSQLKENDVLFSIVGTLGRAGIVSQRDLPANTNQQISIIRLSDVEPSFMLNLLKTPKVVEFIKNNATINVQPSLSLWQLKNLRLAFPSLLEQQAIGTFFSNLDNLITLCQRKVEKLKNLKSAYLSEMLPAEGKREPKRRFRGFANAWEQRKLGELASITTGKCDANEMTADGEFDFYTSGIKKYKIDTATFKGPAITIAGNGATVGYMHLADGLFNAYQRTYILSNFKLERQFIFSEIASKLPKKIQEEARSGNIPYIVLDMLTELPISFPSREEQIAIGSLFSDIDHLITLHQRKPIILFCDCF